MGAGNAADSEMSGSYTAVLADVVVADNFEVEAVEAVAGDVDASALVGFCTGVCVGDEEGPVGGEEWGGWEEDVEGGGWSLGSGHVALEVRRSC